MGGKFFANNLLNRSNLRQLTNCKCFVSFFFFKKINLYKKCSLKSKKKKKDELNPENDFKEYTIELSKKLDCKIKIDESLFVINNFSFYDIWQDTDRKTRKDLIQKLISSIEIKRDKNYEIEITNVKFTEEFISKNSKEYLKYLNGIIENVS